MNKSKVDKLMTDAERNRRIVRAAYKWKRELFAAELKQANDRYDAQSALRKIEKAEAKREHDYRMLHDEDYASMHPTIMQRIVRSFAAVN